MRVKRSKISAARSREPIPGVGDLEHGGLWRAAAHANRACERVLEGVGTGATIFPHVGSTKIGSPSGGVDVEGDAGGARPPSGDAGHVAGERGRGRCRSRPPAARLEAREVRSCSRASSSRWPFRRNTGWSRCSLSERPPDDSDQLVDGPEHQRERPCELVRCAENWVFTRSFSAALGAPSFLVVGAGVATPAAICDAKSSMKPAVLGVEAVGAEGR